MIGAGWIAMIYINKIKRHVAKSTIFVMILTGIFFSEIGNASYRIASLPLTAVTVATCVPLIQTNSYDLGTLVAGTQKKHQPLIITVSCDDAFATSEVKATFLNNGGTLDNTKTAVNINNGVGRFQLLDATGNAVALDGSATFCQETKPGDTDRVCSLTPFTDIRNNATSGAYSLGVSFEVIVK